MMHACIFLFTQRIQPIKSGHIAAFFTLLVLWPWVPAIPYRSCTDPASIPVLVTFSQNRLQSPAHKLFRCFPAYLHRIFRKIKNVLNVKNPMPHFVTVKLIMQLEQCSKSTAWRRINLAGQALQKQQHQRISFQEYNTYYGYDQDSVMRLLGFDSNTTKKHT